MDTLAKEHNKKSMCRILRNLPKDLTRLYEDTIQRVQEQDNSSVRLAWRVLSWLSYAFRPLKVCEIQHALAVDLDDTRFDDEALTDPEDLVSVCAGLVTIDDESQIIRLIHYTTQEYFEQVRDGLFPKARLDIAGVCLTYLTLDDLGEQCDTIDADRWNEIFEPSEDLHKRYPFLSYAMNYWAPHVHGDGEISFAGLIQKFIDKQAMVGGSYSLIMCLLWGRIDRHNCFSTVTIAAFFGLTRNLEAKLKQGMKVNDINGDDHTALYYAAVGGHVDTVRFLLQAGADARAGNSAIGLATRRGNLRLAKLLIDSGGDINRTNDDGVLPALHDACERGDERVVRFMLDHGADVNSFQHAFGITPLWRAVTSDCPNIVAMLLERGADVNFNLWGCPSVLFMACSQGNTSIARLLVAAHGCDPNFARNSEETPLHAAIERDCGAIVQLLIAHGANADVADRNGRTPLFAAADCCSESALQMLVEHGVDINRRSLDGRTVLSSCRERRKVLEGPYNIIRSRGRLACRYPLLLQGISTKSLDSSIQFLVDHGATE